MSTIKRIGGAILIVISIASLLFSLAALAGVWIVRKPITDTMTAGLMLASDTLEVTGRTLGVVDDGLATAGDLVASTQQTVDSLAITLDSTTPALQTVGDLVGSGVPAALTAANATIRTAQKSAETVDGVLTVLSQLPLLNIVPHCLDRGFKLSLRKDSRNLSEYDIGLTENPQPKKKHDCDGSRPASHSKLLRIQRTDVCNGTV